MRYSMQKKRKRFNLELKKVMTVQGIYVNVIVDKRRIN